MREDVEFTSAGVRLRGWLYRPDGGGGNRPALVMNHAFSAVKEERPDGSAERFHLATEPLIIVAATSDIVIPVHSMPDAFAQTGESRKLVELDCGHFEVTTGTHDVAAGAATE